MKFFKNLLHSKIPKSPIKDPFAHLVCQRAKLEGVKLDNNFEYLEELSAKNLLRLNKKFKYSEDLIKLWAMLDMRKYLECFFELTVNPYVENIPAKDLDHYLSLPAKYHTILDIKLIDKFKIQDTTFKKTYFVTYEIKDELYNVYCPYVEVFTKNEDGSFSLLGYGYDTNYNDTVELFIKNFNYAVLLSADGYIKLPLKNTKIKLHVYDILTSLKVKSLFNNLTSEDIEIN